MSRSGASPAAGKAGATDMAAVLQALGDPAGWFVEAGAHDATAPASPGHSLGLVVRTDTAHHLPIATAFVTALTMRDVLPPMLAEPVEVALQEAVSNAVLHGNLGISSGDRSTAQGFHRFCDTIAARLADPIASARPVRIAARWRPGHLSIAVSDKGEGFRLAAQQAPGVEMPHGRGLTIMRGLAQRVSWNQGRRRLLLTFRHDAVCAS